MSSFAAELLINPKAKVGGSVPPIQNAPACSSTRIESDGKQPKLASAVKQNKCGNCGAAMDTSKLRIAGKPICNKCRTPEMRSESTTDLIKARLEESAAFGKSLILSTQEVLALKQWITEMEFDPFRDQKAVLDTRDLEKLGLEVDNNPAPNANDEDEELPPDPFNDGEQKDDQPKDQATQTGADRINISTAIVAPDATPGHDEPIPQSVLQSLDVLAARGHEQPMSMPQQVPPGPGPSTTPAPHPVPPQHPEQTAPTPPPPMPATESKAVPVTEFMGRFRKAYRKEAGTLTEEKPAADKKRVNEDKTACADPTKGAAAVGNFMNKFRRAAKNSGL